MATKAKVEVFEERKDPPGKDSIATFDTIEELIKWNETHNVRADQITVNGLVLLGWDELYDFI